MTPGYDPNKGVDDFRREHDADAVSDWFHFQLSDSRRSQTNKTRAKNHLTATAVDLTADFCDRRNQRSADLMTITGSNYNL